MSQPYGKPMDVVNSPVQPNDTLIVPRNNTNLFSPKPDDVVLREKLQVIFRLPIAVMNKSANAGYYSDRWGELPFVVGVKPVEEFFIFTFQTARRGVI